jgi:4-amino-4-deoxy-L-arabinose transferase-like glycosyltransferase
MAPAKDETNGVDEEAPASAPKAVAAVEEALSENDPGSAMGAVPAHPRALGSLPQPPPGGRDGYRLFALGIAVLVLFPILARSGIWDPYELDAADLARRIAARVFGATSLDLPGGVNGLPTLTDLHMGELPFTSMALGFKLFGLHDWTGRLPLAVWGLAGVVVLYETMARLVDRRAGLYSVVALVTMPLYFMQARTMLGDIVTMSALTLAFCGLAGALLDTRGKLTWLGIGAVGLLAGYLSRGLILGVAVPALSVGIAWVVLRGAQMEADPSPDSEAVGGLSLLIGVLALYFGVRVLASATPDGPLLRSVGFVVQRRPSTDATFDLVVRQLGHALFPWSAFLPFALGRLLRAPVEAPAPSRARETGVRVALLVGAAVTYGAFALLAPRSGALPFTAPAILAAVAGVVILDFERGAPHSRALSLGTVVLGTVIFADIYREPERALVAFVVDKPQFPKTFEGTAQTLMIVVLLAFAGLTALAWWESQPREVVLSPAVWVRRMRSLYQELFTDLCKIWNGNLIFAMVVVEAALIGLGAMIFIGRRLSWPPVDKLPKNYADIGVNVWWILPVALAALPALICGVRDGFRAVVGRVRLSRASFTLVAALIAGGTLSFGYYPALAAQLSPKEGFESYARLSRPGEPLALLSVRGRAAAYYGGGEAPSFTDANRAFAWLTEKRDARRWLLLKADDLSRMNALFRAQMGKNLPILDGRSSQILLASNQLGDRPNETWLAKLVLDDPPRPAQPLDVLFEDQLQAIGWEVVDKDEHIVDSVVPATRYHLHVYFKVLKPITGTWKLFVHIDGFQRRFNGDHAVLDGKYAMNLWHPGDVVMDDFTFQLEPNFMPGGYTLYFGFFAGDTRFKVTKGQNHENRVIAGILNVR